MKPAGEPERRLHEAVEQSYPSTAEFYKAVAKERGSEVATEKRAYYRIVNGDVGAKSARRIRTYAKLLNVKPEDLLRSEELPREDQPVRLEDLLERVIELVEKLLAQRGRPGGSSGRRG